MDVYDIDEEILAGQEFCCVPAGTFQEVWLQVVPSGLLSPGGEKANSTNRYSIQYLPPRYCTQPQGEVWKLVCHDFYGVDGGDDPGEELRKRYSHYASVQAHYYRQPPVIERGYKQFLYDDHGRAYLDMVNNVAILGHSPATVTAAVTKQMAMLNTNSRYNHTCL